MGTNLSNDHPVGITYDTALANNDKGLAAPSTKTVTIGSTNTESGTIVERMLVGGKVECTTCHDVHNRYTLPNGIGSVSNNLVKISLAGSSLCLTCHNK